ncbi:MAG: large conductance mechanosensitive channel protein MscL [Ardenticatenales bacterium]|nr:large conductance mechanosensitive channel protein MscL [Ardenticatenales bacterium]
MLDGFKAFIMRGNLIELAVAFIMGAAFATVVTAFTDIIIELLAKAGGAPNFDGWQPAGLTTVGPFLSALVAFLLMAFVVYYFIVKPYEAVKARYTTEEAAAEDPQLALLKDIRDALRAR